jgi:Zn-dependent protease with chaperone function
MSSSNFFEYQDKARRKTGLLVVYFVLAIIAIVIAINALASFLYTIGSDPDSLQHARLYQEWPYFYPHVLILSTIGTLAVIGLGSLYRTVQLSVGGSSLAEMLGGRKLLPATTDRRERQLLNVVEEMAIASGVPVPPVYLFDKEKGINAFAAGLTTSDAVVGVTSGTLNLLSRDELQGVIAHEFSHILNGDMRLNLRLVGLLHGILIIAILGWFVFRIGLYSGGGRSKESGGVAAIGFATGLGLLIIGGIGVFFGRLIQAAVSRQREYLADASAIQFTRNPDGLAGAFKKIGGLSAGSRIESPQAQEMSHIFFSSPFSSQLLSSHPPLVERIKRIDPNFNGRFEKVFPKKKVAPAAQKKSASKSAKSGIPLVGAVIDPARLVGQSGIVGLEQLIVAAAILESIDQPIRDAAHDPYGARAVVYALLLDRHDTSIREKQLDALSKGAEKLSFAETTRLSPVIDRLPPEAIFPLIETTFPALKQLSPGQYEAFRVNIEKLIAADDMLDLHEYATRTLVELHLDTHFGHKRSEPSVAGGMQGAVAQLLSTLAHVGTDDGQHATEAFGRGMRILDRKAALLEKSECGIRQLDPALRAVRKTSPTFKRQFLIAAVAVISSDGKVTPDEAGLYRVLGAILGIPLPPIST